MKLMKLKMKYRKRFFPQFFRQSLKFDISLKEINIFFIDNKKLLVSITVCSCAVKFTRNLEVNACERVDEILKKIFELPLKYLIEWPTIGKYSLRFINKVYVRQYMK